MAAEDRLDLDLPINPVAPDPAPVVARHAASVHHHPRPETARLALAAVMGVDPDELVLTSGAAEAFALVAAELPAGQVEGGHRSIFRPDTADPVERSTLRWRSNPDDLSGRLAPPEETAAVFDEAFYPLAAGEWTRGDHRKGALVIGSLTSLLACPGLRIGYILSADPEVRAHLAARQSRWPVNSLACSALPELLDVVDLSRWRHRVAGLRADLVDLLEGFGLDVEPSDACYVLVRQMPGLRDLLAPQGVTVRDCGSFGVPDATRIAVPDHRGLERLDSALRGATSFLLGSGPMGLRSSSPTTQLPRRRARSRDCAGPSDPGPRGN
jgi:histidinol-phosphate/aromatic aminotransferase/cobyric acid decarboxylase-like protein